MRRGEQQGDVYAAYIYFVLAPNWRMSKRVTQLITNNAAVNVNNCTTLLTVNGGYYNLQQRTSEQGAD